MVSFGVACFSSEIEIKSRKVGTSHKKLMPLTISSPLYNMWLKAVKDGAEWQLCMICGCDGGEGREDSCKEHSEHVLRMVGRRASVLEALVSSYNYFPPIKQATHLLRWSI